MRRRCGGIWSACFPARGLDSETLTSLDVVESAYDLALDGTLPYGDTPSAIGAPRPMS